MTTEGRDKLIMNNELFNKDLLFDPIYFANDSVKYVSFVEEYTIDFRAAFILTQENDDAFNIEELSSMFSNLKV